MKQCIWIVNQYGTTPEYPASSRHYELSKYLSKWYDVKLLASNFIHHNKTYRFSPWTIVKEEKLEGFIINWIGSIPYKDNGMFRIVNMLLFPLMLLIVGIFRKERPSYIIGSSPTLFTAFSAMLIAKWKRASFIMEVRDLWPDSLVEISGKSPNSLAVKAMAFLERALYNHSDRIIILTQGMEGRLIEKGINPAKLFFLPNGIDIKCSSSSVDVSIKRNIRRKIGVGEEDILLMYAGAHGPANDLSQIIYTAHQLRDEKKVRFVLIGEGVEKRALMKLSDEMGLKNVTFVPAVAKSEINHYLACADAFIICLKNIPLFTDALPNKLFDYLLHNKYIITTVKGEIQKVLEHHHVGFYGNIKEEAEYYLPEVCKKVIAKLHYNNNKNHKIGLSIVEKYYNRERQAEQLKKLLMQIGEEKK